MKKLVKRSAALLFAVALVMSMLVVPASAAYKEITRGDSVCVNIYTGAPTSNWPYHTAVIIRNTSYRNSIWIFPLVKRPWYTPGQAIEIRPQTSKVFYPEGAYKNYYVTIQRGLGTIEVSTVERGSVYVDYNR